VSCCWPVGCRSRGFPPDHILDLRAQARLRRTLIEQHCQWQQRIQAVLYHHGCPHRRRLMEGDGLQWLDGQPLPVTARQQVTVALAVIDMLEREIDPVKRELRDYARRQAGCQALIDALLRHRGADRGHDRGRARRLPAVCQQPRRGPLPRPGNAGIKLHLL
jgi:FtsZ-binding cell division protein ZapB